MKEIRKLIEKGKLGNAINKLLEKSSDFVKDLRNQLTICSRRYQDYKKEVRIGTSEDKKELNSITLSILEIVDEIENTPLSPSKRLQNIFENEFSIQPKEHPTDVNEIELDLEKHVISDILLQESKNFENKDISEKIIRAKVRWWQIELRRQENLENILTKTISILDRASKPEGICKDWINYFVSSSIDVSNPKLQLVWARILSYESLYPSSIARRTLSFLRSISLEDYTLIESFFKYALLTPEKKYGLILEHEFYDLVSLAQHSDEIVILENLGLIKTDLNLDYAVRSGKILDLYSGNYHIHLKNNLDIKKVLKVIFLNRVFFDLALVASHELDEMYRKTIISLFERKKLEIKVSKNKLVPIRPPSSSNLK